MFVSSIARSFDFGFDDYWRIDSTILLNSFWFWIFCMSAMKNPKRFRKSVHYESSCSLHFKCFRNLDSERIVSQDNHRIPFSVKLPRADLALRGGCHSAELKVLENSSDLLLEALVDSSNLRSTATCHNTHNCLLYGLAVVLGCQAGPPSQIASVGVCRWKCHLPSRWAASDTEQPYQPSFMKGIL